MSRKLPFGDGEAARTACARALVRTGIDEKTGEVLPAAVVAERVDWCIGLVRGMAGWLLADHWSAPDMDALATGTDVTGRALPANAWMALRRLGWAAIVPDGVTVNDRIARMAQEQAGRTLRSACWRASLTAAVLATWPARPLKRTPEEWRAVRAAVPGGEHLPSSTISARTRQVMRFLKAHGRLPKDVFELEPAPGVTGVLLLSACDKQQATIERLAADPKRALLRLKLPVRPDPRGYHDWTWVALPLTLPPTVPPRAVLHLPDLRVTEGRVRADLAFTHAVPAVRGAGHQIALGVDWGLNTLLSAGAAQLFSNGTIIALGAGAQFRVAGVLAKQHRLRRHAERLRAKASHYDRLIAGSARHPLIARRAVLAEEIRRVSERRRNLNGALARSAACWVVDQAITAGATVIYLEDLRSMEARGMGRTLNTRLSQTIRGQIADSIWHAAAEHGIAVVAIPPRGTSRHCPRCLAPLQHVKAPDQPAVPGWKWAICPDLKCGWQGDRDQGAWQRIAARGLAHQHLTVTSRDSAVMTIHAISESLESMAVITLRPRGLDRSKVGPTRSRTTSPVPRRRGAPSSARPGGRVGQRPEGHATEGRHLPRAVRRNQDVPTTTAPTRRHQPRGAALGAGFHLHAHATPPRWVTAQGP